MPSSGKAGSKSGTADRPAPKIPKHLSSPTKLILDTITLESEGKRRPMAPSASVTSTVMADTWLLRRAQPNRKDRILEEVLV
jgi:hypothetical protein